MRKLACVGLAWGVFAVPSFSGANPRCPDVVGHSSTGAFEVRSGGCGQPVSEDLDRGATYRAEGFPNYVSEGRLTASCRRPVASQITTCNRMLPPGCSLLISEVPRVAAALPPNCRTELFDLLGTPTAVVNYDSCGAVPMTSRDAIVASASRGVAVVAKANCEVSTVRISRGARGIDSARVESQRMIATAMCRDNLRDDGRGSNGATVTPARIAMFRECALQNSFEGLNSREAAELRGAFEQLTGQVRQRIAQDPPRGQVETRSSGGQN